MQSIQELDNARRAGRLMDVEQIFQSVRRATCGIYRIYIYSAKRVCVCAAASGPHYRRIDELGGGGGGGKATTRERLDSAHTHTSTSAVRGVRAR